MVIVELIRTFSIISKTFRDEKYYAPSFLRKRSFLLSNHFPISGSQFQTNLTHQDIFTFVEKISRLVTVEIVYQYVQIKATQYCLIINVCIFDLIVSSYKGLESRISTFSTLMEHNTFGSSVKCTFYFSEV